MIDFGVSERDRRWWYRKMMAAEEIRQKASRENTDSPIKAGAKDKIESEK